jgi:hypothetical protein
LAFVHVAAFGVCSCCCLWRLFMLLPLAFVHVAAFGV